MFDLDFILNFKAFKEQEPNCEPWTKCYRDLLGEMSLEKLLTGKVLGLAAV